MAAATQVLVDGEFTSPDRPIGYDPVFDEFRAASATGRDAPPLRRCPWCGADLGPGRRAAWYDRLDELGLRPDDDLPAELLSDAWWSNGAPA